MRLAVSTALDVGGLPLGASIAVDGVCLTVVERASGRFAADLGPEMRMGERIDSLKALLAEDYDAIFVGSGAPRGRDLDIPGRQEASENIHIGIDWLSSVSFGHINKIGRRVIVSFPNFGHWRVRTQLLFGGKMPTTDNLPDRWYDTPNIHLCTIQDFMDLCCDAGARVERVVALNACGTKLGVSMPLFAQNLFGEQAVFLLSR